MDESQSQDEFVLAGHVATAEAWANLAKDWDELLQLGVGTIAKNGKPHFKMTEMRSEERMRRVPLFSGVVDKYLPYSISLRIKMADFADAHEKLQMLCRTLNCTINNLELLKNPYYVAFRTLLSAFHGGRQENPHIPVDEKVAFYFDDRSEKKPIRDAWDEMLENLESDQLREMYGSDPRFENDQEFLGLQAADFWAWWVRDWYEEDDNELPDRMSNFDFRSWQGKRRHFSYLSLTGDALFEILKFNAFRGMFDRDESFRPSFRLT